MSRLSWSVLLLLAAPAPVAGTCATGLAPIDALGGNLAPAPATGFQELFCVEIRNDVAVERTEVAHSGVPLPESLALTDIDRLLLVGPGDVVIAAQFDVLSRWKGAGGRRLSADPLAGDRGPGAGRRQRDEPLRAAPVR